MRRAAALFLSWRSLRLASDMSHSAGNKPVLLAFQEARAEGFGERAVRRQVDTSIVDTLTAHVSTVLESDASQHVHSGTIAFISQSHLIYARDAAQVEELADSSTVILQSLERNSRFFDHLSKELVSESYVRVTFSAYVSTNQSTSLGMHRDEWDNIV